MSEAHVPWVENAGRWKLDCEPRWREPFMWIRVDVIKVEMLEVGDACRNLFDTAIVPDASTNYM